MMKKNGFTLAEVLITLTIIGVIAALTLPALMTNVAEQQNITAFKKIMNTLNEAGQMNSAVNGFNYSQVTATTAINDSVDNNSTSLMALLNARTQVDQEGSGVAKINTAGSQCGTANWMNAFLRDGTVVCFPTAAPANPYINIWVDVNGLKGPNRPSTCDVVDCTNKAGRNINDQFPVVLYGGSAIPGHWNAIETVQNNEQYNAAAFAMRG